MSAERSYVMEYVILREDLLNNGISRGQIGRVINHTKNETTINVSSKLITLKNKGIRKFVVPWTEYSLAKYFS
jgi:hypothetical protein